MSIGQPVADRLGDNYTANPRRLQAHCPHSVVNAAAGNSPGLSGRAGARGSSWKDLGGPLGR